MESVLNPQNKERIKKLLSQFREDGKKYEEIKRYWNPPYYLSDFTHEYNYFSPVPSFMRTMKVYKVQSQYKIVDGKEVEAGRRSRHVMNCIIPRQSKLSFFRKWGQYYHKKGLEDLQANHWMCWMYLRMFRFLRVWFRKVWKNRKKKIIVQEKKCQHQISRFLISDLSKTVFPSDFHK